MNEEKESVSERIKQFFQFFSGYHKVEMVPRTEREKQIIRIKIFWAVFITILVVLLFIFLPSFFSTNFSSLITDNFEAVLTAIVTITTTYFIVHQSKRVDYHRERLEHIPIFELVANSNNSKIDLVDTLYAGEGFYAILEVANVGNGIAFNVEAVEIGAEDYPANFHTIKIDGVKGLKLKCNCDESNQFVLRFIYNDLFENLYHQDFIVQFSEKKEVELIQSKTPELVRRTRRFRYTQ